MTSPKPNRIWIFRTSLRAAIEPLALAIVLALAVVANPAAQAQTFTVLHSFTDGADGAEPYAGVTMDRMGNLYGTTTAGGGNNGGGTVFKLSHRGTGWTLSTLYAFVQTGDGSLPAARVVFSPDGTLYGTTYYGGQTGNGTVFNLRPPATACRSVLCPWTETVLYSFTGGNDGSHPYFGDLIFDSAGNIYGTTNVGGAHGEGVVFKLTHSNGDWTESVLYSFTGGNDGSYPYSGVIFDSTGNLYGTATYGGSGFNGAVYELSPSGSGWTESTVYSFTGGASDGGSPIGGITFDAHGNLYGTTNVGGPGDGGTAWELTPSGGNWNFTLLQGFEGYQGPYDTPTLDAAGNVYGTSIFSGGGDGEAFELTPSGGGWHYTSYAFNGNDGYAPTGGVVLDAEGNLYGTTFAGGTGHGQNCSGCGVVFEISP